MLQIDREEFENLVVQALDELPAWVHEMMDNVEVTVADAPSVAQLRRQGLRPQFGGLAIAADADP